MSEYLNFSLSTFFVSLFDPLHSFDLDELEDFLQLLLYSTADTNVLSKSNTKFSLFPGVSTFLIDLLFSVADVYLNLLCDGYVFSNRDIISIFKYRNIL